MDFCSHCNTSLEEKTTPPKPCNKCGSFDRHMTLEINDAVSVDDLLKGKIIDPSLPSKKKKRVEFIQGNEIRKKDGEMINKERLIDKRNDKYKEVVTDPETGEILHYCEEPLSVHQGHGKQKI